MLELGSLDDLPQDYRDALSELNLVPLWPSLRKLLPPGVPERRTQPVCWPYQSLRPLLMQAGELTPIEKAERRVLVLANPGHGLEKLQASASIYLGMQLLLPGEIAPSHRHTPNAVRMVVEGEGAYTTVDGWKCVMKRGDLILTPTGLWHDHGHDGDQAVTWLDVLDLPLIYHLETSYVQEGKPQKIVQESSPFEHAGAGVLPTPMFESEPVDYPVLRYAWSEVRQRLEGMAQLIPALPAVQVSYVNPQSGAAAQNILGYSALMLRPGETLTLPARSCAMVMHIIEGKASIAICDKTFEMQDADTCCAPGYEPVVLKNQSTDLPAYLFIADESPLHKKLGVYEVRT